MWNTNTMRLNYVTNIITNIFRLVIGYYFYFSRIHYYLTYLKTLYFSFIYEIYVYISVHRTAK